VTAGAGVGDEAGGGERQRKMFKGEIVSGNVLTENEVMLVGSSPTRSAITALVFQFSVDFHLSFSAGDLVLVPRSKGGLSYGVLGASQDAKGRVVWSVEMGHGAFKSVPQMLIGKILGGSTRTRADTLEPSRALGREPLLIDLRSVVFALSSAFDEMEVVLLPRARGGLVYGYVVAKDGAHHYLVKGRVGEESKRAACYAIGKLNNLTPKESQSILGPVLAKGITVESVTSAAATVRHTGGKRGSDGQGRGARAGDLGEMKVKVLARPAGRGSGGSGRGGGSVGKSSEGKQGAGSDGDSVGRGDGVAGRRGGREGGRSARAGGEGKTEEEMWREKLLEGPEGEMWLQTPEGLRWLQVLG